MIKSYILTFILVLNFSFPINAQSFQQVKPWMGIAIEDKEQGVGIKEAMPGTPAKKAGLKSGDLVKKIDATPIKNTQHLIEYIQSKGVGNEVIVEFERDKRINKVTLKLEAKPDELEVIRKRIIGKDLPEFSAETINGKPPISKKDIQNKVTVIEFWATWCGPCVASHRKLSEFAEANQAINILAISDEKEDLIKAYAKKTNHKFMILRDPNYGLAHFFAVSAIPTTVVIDQKGVVRFVTIGAGSYQEEALNYALELNKTK